MHLGPSFAKEILQNNPTAVVVASHFLYHSVFVSRILSSSHFHCYPSQDVLGVELCGALKNPLAIGWVFILIILANNHFDTLFIHFYYCYLLL
jgi:glycerol-3-phosphate dehydrogenase